MAKPPETMDPQNWHRFFGASANNAAWQFAEQAPETVNARELLNAAHTAAWHWEACLLYTSPSPRDLSTSRMPSSA